MRSFLLASFALLTLVVVGCDTAETPKPAETPKVDAPKDKMEPTPTPTPAPDAPKDKMEPTPAPTTPAAPAAPAAPETPKVEPPK